MPNFKPIRVQNATLHKDGRMVRNYIHVFDRELRKYFKSFHFYAEYNRKVSKVPLSVLNIPALSSVIPFAWSVGCDLEIDELDETYFTGVENARLINHANSFLKPLSFDTELTVKKTATNEFGLNGRNALFFSGGLDSMASYLLRRPHVTLMYWGYDIPLDWEVFWRKVKREYRSVKPLLVKTNSLEMYDNEEVHGDIGRKLPVDLWSSLAFSIHTFGVSAPLSVNRVDTLLMVSTYPSKWFNHPEHAFMNRPQLYANQHLGFADVKTYDVEHEYNRVDKVKRIIKPSFEEEGYRTIRTCGHIELLKKRKYKKLLNCCVCFKCFRTIGNLVAGGVDPNLCGFHVDESTYRKIKSVLTSNVGNVKRIHAYWRPIKEGIPLTIEDDFNGSQKFLRWLRGYPL